MADAGPVPLGITVEGSLDAERVLAIIREVAPRVLPALLPRRRWYGEKDRRVTAVAVDDLTVVEVGGSWVALLVVHVSLDQGEAVPYFVPLSLIAAPASGMETLALVRTTDRTFALIEAFASSSFATWFLGGIATDRDLPTGNGRFAWRSLPAGAARLGVALAAAPRLGTAEQSNTAVHYGDAVFLKVFRRLRAGVNPDEEIGTYLATRTSFDHLPAPIGVARYHDGKGDEYSVALAQSFVPNVGDGWSFALDALASSPSEFARAARRLGERTAELHFALGQPTHDPAFAPELIVEEDARGWEEGVRRRLATMADVLHAPETGLDPSLRSAVRGLVSRLPELERRASGFRHQIGGRKVRVHGDYHLGQVLRTPDRDWTILDFEGEPLRSIAERRAKTSPLKDVAGMLHSFGYARSAVLGAGDAATESAALTKTEVSARRAFLDGYRETSPGRVEGLIPEPEAAFVAAVLAWELDKALYQLDYELRNRPDWVGHALTTLIGASSPPSAEPG